jgi:hypothetical protein
MQPNTSLMRTFWSVVEETSSVDLLTLNDKALVATLVQQISQQTWLTGEEMSTLYGYIGSKIALIRDVAGARLMAN